MGAVAAAGSRPRRRARRPAAAPALVAIAFALLATLLPAPQGRDAAAVAREDVPAPRVVDVRPAPGAVVPAGPVVLAGRVEGGGDLTFLVDGEPVRGRPVDPDGGLTELAGIEVALQPGAATIAAAVDGSVVREWPVVASGLVVQEAPEPATALLRRLPTAPGAVRAAVLVDLDRPQLAAAAAPVAALLGAVAVPVTGGRLDADALAALDRLDPDGPREVLVLGADPDGAGDPGDADDQGGAGGPGDDLDAQLADIGATPVPVPGGDAAQVSLAAAATVLQRLPAPPDAVLVAPAAPHASALSAAVSAARVGASLLLVDAPVDADGAQVDAGPADPEDGEVLLPAAADVLARHRAVLLADTLPAGTRDAVVAALPDGAVASPYDLVQTGADDAVVVPEATAPDRALVASLAAAPGRAVVFGDAAASRWVARERPDRVTILTRPVATGITPALLDPFAPATGRDGQPVDRAGRPAGEGAAAVDPDAPALAAAPDPHAPAAADPEAVRARLERAWVDGADRGAVTADIHPGDPPQVVLTAPGPVRGAVVHVSLLGYEWPGTTEVDGAVVTWTADPRPPLPLPLEPPARGTPTAVEVTSALDVGGRPLHDRAAGALPLDPRPATSPEGWAVAGGTGPVTGTGGRLLTYSVEVEPATGLDLDEVEAEVSRILTDPRSWTADGAVRFQRIGSARARIRVVVATPETVDARCGAVGLRTGGRVSCWDGYRAMLNLDRWTSGVPHFGGDLTTYREYLVNHEVGHGLGHRHVGCPRPGALAPVMVQQTGSTGACRPNGWPFP